MSPGRWADVAEVMGENGGYSGCWCMFWRLNNQEIHTKTASDSVRSHRPRISRWPADGGTSHPRVVMGLVLPGSAAPPYGGGSGRYPWRKVRAVSSLRSRASGPGPSIRTWHAALERSRSARPRPAPPQTATRTCLRAPCQPPACRCRSCRVPAVRWVRAPEAGRAVARWRSSCCEVRPGVRLQSGRRARSSRDFLPSKPCRVPPGSSTRRRFLSCRRAVHAGCRRVRRAGWSR